MDKLPSAYPENLIGRTFGEKLERMVGLLMQDPKPFMLTRPVEQKYLKHAFKTKYAQRPDVTVKRMDLPVCARCESVAFRDRQPGDPPPVFAKDDFGVTVKTNTYVTCPVCHHHGPPGPPVRVHVKEV